MLHSVLIRRLGANRASAKPLGLVLVRSLASKNVLQTLRERGLLAQVSQPENALQAKLESGEKLKLYCGADPTAESLHLGNLLPLMVLLHFYVRGHDVYTLVGGATGVVGDPSGRRTERTAIEETKRQSNVSNIQGQLQRFFDTGLAYYKERFGHVSSGKAVHTNNYDWWHDMKMLDFLGRYGRHIRIQSMLSRDSVSSRLSSQDGLGFNEFTYQILQAYDFYHLNQTHGVAVQVGGNDQWGNITAGIDLISRIGSKSQPFGLTVPLLTTSTGEKFGKSAGNAVFIDPTMNTSFDIYQFFMHTTDEDVARFLRTFTLLPLEEISAVVQRHMECPKDRAAQKLLGREVVDLIHGNGKGRDAEMVSEILFGNHQLQTPGSELVRLFREARHLASIPRGTSLEELLIRVTGCSKSEARRKLKQGSIYLGPDKIRVLNDIESLEQFYIDDQVLILRVGKQKCYVIEIV
ncbi:LAQU0S12e03620g1_1 [Lachancea quebecensis]|uniref:Tyrosine--tRNA ligase n=1 Tax=Lachancea quebecensis TaxID=1654605 RepID=A0A0P1KVV4_9SACH|nr:LAQU0S12e03620g1_1 [Lachancea quebecensis]